MASGIYNNAKELLLLGDLHLDSDTIHVALVTSSYTPDFDSDVFFSTPEANEVSGTGYTAGGQALSSKTVSQDNTDDEGVFDAADVTWSSSTITARGAVIYQKLGGASSADPLIAYIDFGEDKVSSSGNFTIQWNAEGILNLG